MARAVNQADQALSEALARRDVDASPRKIEAMRQAGMLEEARRRGLGRGRGSRSLRAADEINRAEYMAKLLAECGSYADAVLVAFVRGDYAIAKHRLEHAYAQSFGAVLAWIDKHAGPTTPRFERPYVLGGKVARYVLKGREFRPIRDRLRYLGQVAREAPMHRAVQDLATDIFALVIGTDHNPTLTAQAAANVETFTGDGSLSDPAPSTPVAASGSTTFAELASRLHLAALIRVVGMATMQELARARDHAKTFRDFARDFGSFAQQRVGPGRAFAWVVLGAASDRAVAYAIPGLVVLHRLHGGRLDATMAFMAEWTPFFAAANIVLDQLPNHLNPLAHPNGYESMTADERQQLAQHLEQIGKTHPRELELITNPPEFREIAG